MATYREDAERLVQHTRKGVKVELRRLYYYAHDDHVHLQFGDGTIWTFESEEQFMQHVGGTLLAAMKDARSS